MMKRFSTLINKGGSVSMRSYSTAAQKKAPQPDGSTDYQQFMSAFFKEQELQSRDMEL
jgi:hypothetical protein